MKLSITDEAASQLKRLSGEQQPMIRLFYDTEGCGCGVNGLPTIRLDQKKRETDKTVDNQWFSVVIDDQQAIFFKPEMKLDFLKGSFRLSSPEGILNPIISSKDVKEGAVL
ncbi:iron-sulfur cluster biosynthesis family protein [Halobacillus salinarum]|uniref:Iron-sulfur cluster biosynthesis family protein n=1 Tax=Halobacillus salinarum TaxID=2932257 RepID=A0ABY4EF78_9BACI|nr:iron-sulfur cluster biosynthesis family protein [Halobacillus salinarum]UOQ42635.1 iron-sulfur cluster biosynthesis family protein [Halobacillus salinarum]